MAVSASIFCAMSPPWAIASSDFGFHELSCFPQSKPCGPQRGCGGGSCWTGRKSHMKGGMPWKVRDNICAELTCVRHSGHQGSAVRLSLSTVTSNSNNPAVGYWRASLAESGFRAFLPTRAYLWSSVLSLHELPKHYLSLSWSLNARLLSTLICKALAFNYPWIPLVVLRWRVFKSFFNVKNILFFLWWYQPPWLTGFCGRITKDLRVG